MKEPINTKADYVFKIKKIIQLRNEKAKLLLNFLIKVSSIQNYRLVSSGSK